MIGKDVKNQSQLTNMKGMSKKVLIVTARLHNNQAAESNLFLQPENEISNPKLILTGCGSTSILAQGIFMKT